MTQAEDRVGLETKISFLEHTVDALSEMVVAQGRSLDSLERKFALIEGRLRSREDGMGGDAGDLADEKPPHY